MKRVFTWMALAAMLLIACGKTPQGNDPSGDQPGGTDQPGGGGQQEQEIPDPVKEIDVAKDALVVWLPLDDIGTVRAGGLVLESRGGSTDANFVEGRRGKCYQGGVGTYLQYALPAESPVKHLKSMSLSMWLKHAEVSGTEVPMVFQITGGDDPIWGNFALASDRTSGRDGWLTWKVQWQMGTYGHLWKATDQVDGFNEELQVSVNPWANAFPAGRWNHIIWCYDNAVTVKDEEGHDITVAQYHCYVNGVDVTPESHVWCMRSEKDSFGDLGFIDVQKILIGGWDAKVNKGYTDAWMGDFSRGQVDEIRLFSRSLTAEEAKALYDAEVDHMNE